MKITHTNPYLSLVNEYLADSPAPNNINYLWNFGSLLGVNLVILIITGVTLAMHYVPDISLAFSASEHYLCALKITLIIENLSSIRILNSLETKKVNFISDYPLAIIIK